MGKRTNLRSLVKHSLLVLPLAFLFSLALIQYFKPYHPKSLYGYFTPLHDPSFSIDSAWSGVYQRRKADFMNANFGYRNYLVRLYNQVDFSLFRLAHAKRIVAGQDHYLYSTNYIDLYLGLSKTDKNFITAKVKEIKLLQEVLWNQYHIFLFPVFAPDKGTVYPEYLPARYQHKKKTVNNYEYYVLQCRLQGVRFFDANRYFLALMDTARYPLYPQTGIHWSEYGAVLAADTVFRSLQSYTGIPVPEIRIKSLNVTRNLMYGDDDIALTMNLLCVPDHPDAAYPVLGYVRDTSVAKPAALFTGDSFFWQWYNIGIIHHLFRNVEFWYYDEEIYPVSFVRVKKTYEVNLRQEILKQNFIIIVSTNGGAGNFGNGFIDRLYAEFDPSPDNPIRAIEKQIRTSPVWYQSMVRKAEEKRRPLEWVIRNDAIYLYDSRLHRK